MELYMTDLHDAGSMMEYLLDIVANDVHILNVNSTTFTEKVFQSHHDYEIAKSLLLHDKYMQMDNGFYLLMSPEYLEKGNAFDYFYCHINDKNVDRIYFDSKQLESFKVLLNHESDKDLRIYDLVYDYINDYMKDNQYDENTIQTAMNHFKDDNFEAIQYINFELADKFKEFCVYALITIVDEDLMKEQDIEKNEDIEME